MAGPEIRITFPGNQRVDADLGGFSIPTDQTVKNGGEASAPEPYNLFLASIGTCAGYYILAFCHKRGIPMDGISLLQRHVFDEKDHVLEEVALTITLPVGFPEKYRKAVVQAAASCGVKKAIAVYEQFIGG